MTPLEFAEALKNELATLSSLPTPATAQLGNIVIPCAGTYVSVASTSQANILDVHCEQSVELADVQVAVAFDCAVTFDDDGVTDQSALSRASKQMDDAGVALTSWAVSHVKDGQWGNAQFNGTSFAIDGGLAVVTIGLTLPVP